VVTALHAYSIAAPRLAPLAPAPPTRRFDQLAIASFEGDPLNGGSAAGAASLAPAFRRLGIRTVAVSTAPSRGETLRGLMRHMLDHHALPRTGEQLHLCSDMRRRAAERIARAAARLGVRHVLHLSTLDLPAIDIKAGVTHYLYCDRSWLLSLRFRRDVRAFSARALWEYERLERQALSGVSHVFTCGNYVRDNLIEHYGLAAGRVTSVGSGMGPIQPYFGAKEYDKRRLLFVVRNGVGVDSLELLADAFVRAQARRPGLSLTIVGAEPSRRMLNERDIVVRPRAPWSELQRLYRRASLLVQPMLNDPWCPIYLEALVSRTPVLGLGRNGLPEILQGGRHGFLVEKPEAGELARAILTAVAEPGRLAAMGASGQRRVLESYSWNRVAEQIAHA
jgi:glycosyltransferase involved in cell wall biosynthesis